MKRKIEITWEVEDGYAGKARPHYYTITENDIMMDWEEWDELSSEEQEKEIEQIIQEEFKRKISWGITNQKEIKNG